MKKDLINKLKDAGVPDIRIGEYFEHRVGSHSDDRGGASDAPCYCNEDKIPTLSELIDACGDNFVRLEKAPMMWIAYSSLIRKTPEFNGVIVGPGDTPEEAVAIMLIALYEEKARKE